MIDLHLGAGLCLLDFRRGAAGTRVLQATRSPMCAKFVLNTAVSYKDVDRDETLLLSAAFKFLQEAAIQHANQFDLGTRGPVTRGEAWVLNRMAAAFHRYPRHEESLRIETWSSGIHGFRGYREYRLYAGNDLAISCSSLWLYLNVKSKALVRVPLETAARFPADETDIYEPHLDKFAVHPPGTTAPAFELGIRYGDIDGNGHVNNTAYLDLLQTALIRGGLPARPRTLQIKFTKEIRPEVESVRVQLEARASSTVFDVGREEISFAQGQVT